MEQIVVSRQRLTDILLGIGLVPGDAVVVHGSLRSFGHVAGGPSAVAEAVMHAVGSSGLVVMPVYAQSMDAHDDLLRTPDLNATVSTGAIPAAFSRLPDVCLSAHPLYGFAFSGQNAAKLARACERLLLPYGARQPLACLYPRQGKILQLGVDDRTNTSIHVAEELADPAYLSEKKSVSTLTVDEFFSLPVASRRLVMQQHRAGPRRDFRTCTPLIEEAGIRRVTAAGNARIAVTDFVKMIDLLVDAMQRDPYLMTGTPEDCHETANAV